MPCSARRIPLVAAVREGGDAGRPVVAVAPSSEVAVAFHLLTERIVEVRPGHASSVKNCASTRRRAPIDGWGRVPSGRHGEGPVRGSPNLARSWSGWWTPRGRRATPVGRRVVLGHAWSRRGRCDLRGPGFAGHRRHPGAFDIGRFGDRQPGAGSRQFSDLHRRQRLPGHPCGLPPYRRRSGRPPSQPDRRRPRGDAGHQIGQVVPMRHRLEWSRTSTGRVCSSATSWTWRVSAKGATALHFQSFDGVYTESLTLDQARPVRCDRRLPDARWARHPASTAAPCRCSVAPMYGYKSIKWLSTHFRRGQSNTSRAIGRTTGTTSTPG